VHAVYEDCKLHALHWRLLPLLEVALSELSAKTGFVYYDPHLDQPVTSASSDVLAAASAPRVFTMLEKIATARVVEEVFARDDSGHRAGDILSCYQLLMDGAAWAAANEVMHAPHRVLQRSLQYYRFMAFKRMSVRRLARELSRQVRQ